MSTRRTHFPTAEEAFQDYLALQGRRSVERLLAFWKERGDSPLPSIGCVKGWSARHAWVERAEEFDIQVNALASRKLIERQASERAEGRAAFESASLELLRKVRAAIPEMWVENLHDMRLLVDMADVLIARAYLLPEEERGAAQSGQADKAAGAQILEELERITGKSGTRSLN